MRLDMDRGNGTTNGNHSITAEIIDLEAEEDTERRSSVIHEKHSSNSSRKYIYEGLNHVVEIYADNLKCLQPKAYLDDSVMRFFTAYLLKEIVNEETANSFHVFDSYFHSKLCETFNPEPKKDQSQDSSNGDSKKSRSKDRYMIDHVKWKQLNKWFTGVDVFEKNFLIFPICQEEHWFVVIVCYPNEVELTLERNVREDVDSEDSDQIKPKPVPGLIVLDSLNQYMNMSLNKWMITKSIRDFLDFEWRARFTTIKDFSYESMKQYHPNLPSQQNAYDCGVFTMAYLQAFAWNPEKFYRLVRNCCPTKSNSSPPLPTYIAHSIGRCLEKCEREKIRDLIVKRCELRE